jgi:hypothetical protein
MLGLTVGATSRVGVVRVDMAGAVLTMAEVAEARVIMPGVAAQKAAKAGVTITKMGMGTSRVAMVVMVVMATVGSRPTMPPYRA